MRVWPLAMVALLLASISLHTPIRGVNEMLIWDTDAELERTFSMMHAAGIESVRVNWAWQDVQRGPGIYDFTRLDNIARVAEKYGVGILPILLDPPERDHFLLNDWQRYVKAAVSHFPNFPNWEVWNEENLGSFPVQKYLDFLSITYRAIKRINPKVGVVLGGLAHADTDYLRALYRLGGGQFFDVVSIHIYSDPEYGILPVSVQAERIRAVMKDYGDLNKPIWLTEIGWATDQPDTAAFLQQVYSGLLPVQAIYWYNFRDLKTGTADPEDNYGLLRTDFSPKLAYEALRP